MSPANLHLRGRKAQSVGLALEASTPGELLGPDYRRAMEEYVRARAPDFERAMRHVRKHWRSLFVREYKRRDGITAKSPWDEALASILRAEYCAWDPEAWARALSTPSPLMALLQEDTRWNGCNVVVPLQFQNSPVNETKESDKPADSTRAPE